MSTSSKDIFIEIFSVITVQASRVSSARYTLDKGL